MKEIDYQRLVIDVVKDHGGFAFKSSNRFLVGVADLYVKVPEYPGVFLEAKLDKMPILKSTVSLDTTIKQRHFLRDAYEAGTPAGVISFIRGPKELGVTIQHWDHLTIDLDKYKIEPHRNRTKLMWEVLEEWLHMQEMIGERYD